MLNYLARHGYLSPYYAGTGRRGSARFYSFRDLVVARLVSRLLDAGLEISRLKAGIANLSKHPGWTRVDREQNLRLLATDGRSLFFVEPGQSVSDLTAGGQLAFAFVLDLAVVEDEVKQKMSAEQKVRFTTINRPLKYG